MAEKKGFIMAYEYYDILDGLSGDAYKALLQALFHYEITREIIPITDPAVKMAFNFICKDLDNNRKNWEKSCTERAVNGAKGGRPRNETQTPQQIINETQNNHVVLEKPSGFENNHMVIKKPDNECDSECDNENDCECECELRERDPHTFGIYKNVTLSPQNFQKLKNEFGESVVLTVINQLSSKIREGKEKSTDHFATMRRWCAQQTQYTSKAPPPTQKPASPFDSALKNLTEVKNDTIHYSTRS